MLTAAFTVVTMSVHGTHSSWADVAAQVKPVRRPVVQTSLSRIELLGALREGHVRVFGTVPTKNRLAMAWGQVALENGHGKNVYNHNLGNIAPWRADQPRYLSADGNYYRDFDTFVDSAAAYWSTIKHCVPALVKFDSGQPIEATRQLRACHYFDADLAAYTRMLTSLYYFAMTNVIVQDEHEQEERDRKATEEREAAHRAATALDTELDAGIDREF